MPTVDIKNCGGVNYEMTPAIECQAGPETIIIGKGKGYGVMAI